jgi:hypothetical protein
MSNENIIGFYRWTNIYYNWPDLFAEKPAIQSALRSFLHCNSMIHPDHPFSSEEGKSAQLWIGALSPQHLLLNDLSLIIIRNPAKWSNETDVLCSSSRVHSLLAYHNGLRIRG